VCSQVKCRTLFTENKDFPLRNFLNLFRVCVFRYGFFERTRLPTAHLFIYVAQVATRIAVMRASKFVELGPAEQVLHQPKNAYTRELLAAVPELPLASEPSGIAKQGGREIIEEEILRGREKGYGVTVLGGRCDE
jgi:hypothetical protein